MAVTIEDIRRAAEAIKGARRVNIHGRFRS